MSKARKPKSATRPRPRRSRTNREDYFEVLEEMREECKKQERPFWREMMILVRAWMQKHGPKA